MDLPGPDLEQLKARLRELNQDVIEHDRDAAQARKEAQGLNRELADLSEWTKDLHAQILMWKSRFQEIVESRSWKLMAPARFVGTALKRAKALGRFSRSLQRAETSNHSTAALMSGSSSDPLVDDVGSEHHPAAPAIDETRNRRENLEQAFKDLLSAAADTTGNGRYIHPLNDRLDSDFLGVKAIAFYQTQSHLAGSGWIDVSKAAPRYAGQYQPHIPDELGYYDLRIPDVFARQVELARQYGLHGFCFQIESSETLRHPLEQLLSDPALKMAFCVSCTSDAILETSSNPEAGDVVGGPNAGALLQCLARLFNDNRYIRVQEKPLLVVWRIGESDNHIQKWRAWAADAGFRGLYVVASSPDESPGTAATTADATIFDPTLGPKKDVTSEIPFIDPQFRGQIYSYTSMIESDSDRSSLQTVRNVVTGWDSEPLQPGEGRSVEGSSPRLYARWLERSCRMTMERAPQERFLFITSWNNWSAGAHLEPDRRFGYGYLHVTANVLRYYYRDPATEALINDINARFSRTSEAAVIFHCFYEDLIDPIFERYLRRAKDIDLFVTVRSDVSRDAIERMRQGFPNLFFLRYENRGRDIRPFLFALRHIQSMGYRFGCKIHTKKTLQAGTDMGNAWRQKLLDQLLGAPDAAAQIAKKFNENPRLGLLIPRASVEDLREIRHHVDNTFWLDRLLPQLNRSDLIGNYAFSFPAGSMYWFRVDALDGFDQLTGGEDSFEIELGQRDGTLAHALERLVALYAEEKGYSTDTIDVAEGSEHTP